MDIQPPDSSLFSHAPTAGRGGFEGLLEGHEGAVRAYVRSMMPGYEGADDLAQETLMRLWEKRELFEPGSNFKAWAFQIAKFLVMNQRRKLARSPVVLLDEEVMERIDRRWTEMDMEAGPGAGEAQQAALGSCLETLKAEDRRLLHTRYATDESLETYAEREGTRAGTLKARLFRLRDALRTCIERRLAAASS